MSADAFSDETLLRVATLMAGVVTDDIKDVGPLLIQLSQSCVELRTPRRPAAGDPYWRAPLYRTPALEIVQMVFDVKRDWLPHDHGRSHGWVHVLDGDAEHAIYEFAEDGSLRQQRREWLRPGTLTYMPQGLIHTLGPAAEGLVTLFAYAPPITGMGVYDPRRGCGCIVSDDCGAWWPACSGQMVRQFRFPPCSADET